MSRRLEKISEEMKREISRIIRAEIKDPGITSMVSVTKVEVARDLGYAKVFVSLLGDEKDKENTMEGLKRAKGFIKKELGKRIRIRSVPELSFVVDQSIEHGAYITRLINSIREKEGDDQGDDNI